MSIVLGINLSHDTSACLIKDGQIYAAEEERWSRIKHNSRVLPQERLFPHQALKFVLDASGSSLSDIDKIICVSMAIDDVFGENINICEELKYYTNVSFISHHKAHILSGFLLSPFSEAVGLCIDGAGSFLGLDYLLRERVSGYYLSEQNLQRIYSNDDKITISGGSIHKLKNSLGNFYKNFAVRCVPKGDEPEGSMMALASYASNDSYYKEVRKAIVLYPEGRFQIQGHFGTRSLIPYEFGKYIWTVEQDHEIPFEERANLAWAVQKVFEETVIHVLSALYKNTHVSNLVFSGGCALNSKLNGVIIKKTPFKNVYIPPAPHDGGTALGAALYAWNYLLGKDRIATPTTLDWGTPIENITAEEERDLTEKGYTLSRSDLTDKAISLLLDENVLVWAKGKMEFGPRALGNRSIIACPVNKTVKDRVNAIKKRADYRPLAPSILSNQYTRFFTGDADYYMNKTSMVLHPNLVPAIVHKDGSARVQLVTAENEFYGLLSGLQQRNKPPIILNTSLNLKGVPIANDKDDVMDAFFKLDLDAAVIGNAIISKPVMYHCSGNDYKIKCFSPQKIQKALNFIETLYRNRMRDQGTPFMEHPLEVVQILQNEFHCKLDDNALTTALLHDTLWVDYPDTREKIRDLFGEKILQDITILTKPHIIEQRPKKPDDEHSFLCNILDSDSVIIYIKFADRLHNLRECVLADPNKQNRFVYLTKELYLPIIHNNLGTGKWDAIYRLFNRELE